VLVAVVGGFVAAAVGGGDASPAADEPSTTTTAPLSDTAQELLDRLERGRDRTMHVRFESTGATADSGFAVEIWRDRDRVRQDLVLTAPGARTELSAFELPDGNVICQRAAEAEWLCQASRSTATENGEPAGIVEAAAANLAGADVVATDEEVAGRPARCYAITGPAGDSSMCVTDDGVPLRLAVQGQELTATVVDEAVTDSVFELPAEVSTPS
jgi:hypothetical protein